MDVLKFIKKHKYLFIITLFGIFLMMPFFKYYICGDDSIFHLINIYSYGRASIYSKILPVINNDLGLGVGIFYPCLGHAIGGLFLKMLSLIGYSKSVILSIKLVKFIIVFLSSIFMYILAKNIYGDKRLGMVSSIFYISSSYFYVDIFMRESLNESLVFIFIPLVFLGLYYLLNKNNKKLFYIFFIIGYVGMIYSHLVMSVFFTIFLTPYLFVFVKDILKKDNFICLVIASIIILIFTSTFTGLLVEHMLVDKWNIPFKASITIPYYGYVIEDAYKTSSDGLLFINFNYIVIVCFILGIFKLIKDIKKNTFQNRKNIVGILLFSIVVIFFSCFKIFWDNSPAFFKTIQFVWRLVLFSTFGVSLFSAYGASVIYNLFKKEYIWVFSVVLLIILGDFTIYHFSKTKFYDNINEYKINKLSAVIINDYLPKNLKKI